MLRRGLCLAAVLRQLVLQLKAASSRTIAAVAAAASIYDVPAAVLGGVCCCRASG